MRRLTLFAILFAFSVCPSSSLPQQPDSSGGSKPLSPEALLSLRHLSGVEFSPDGSRVALVVAEPSKGDQRSSHIWLFDTSNASFRQLTYSEKSESSPKWWPDGKLLAFLSNRDTNQQIYLLSMSGGESAPLTKGKRNISRFAWAHDGKTIAFLAPDAKTEAEEKKEKDKDDAHVADKDDKRARLWLLTIDTGEAKALTEPKWKISQAVWPPSDTGLVLSATDHPESDQNTERIFSFRLWDTVSGDRKAVNSMTQILAPRGPFGNIRIAADGLRMAFVGCREDGPTPHDLMLAHHGDKGVQNLTGASVDRPVFDYRWSTDGGLLAVVGDGFHTKFIAFTAEGALKDVAAVPAGPNAFGVSDSGEVAFAGQTATIPQELWLWDQRSAPRQISHLNDSWKQ